MSAAQRLREAAALMREHACRGLAWDESWDGDSAADRGWLAPPVAIAVADQLDAEANLIDWMLGLGMTEQELEASNTGRGITAIADAYLGSDA